MILAARRQTGRWRRFPVVRIFLVLVAFVLFGTNGLADSGSEYLPDDGRLRVLDSRLSKILIDGIERSATLRALVERIQSSNVIVMVETRAALKGRLAGTLHWMGASDNTRYVNVRIKAAAKSNALIAGVAHELQHVIEIVEAPWVVDEGSFVQFYRDHGHRVSRFDDLWDTRAAQSVGAQVMRELAGYVEAETGR